MIDLETISEILKKDGFLKNIDITVEETREGYVRLSVPLADNLMRIGGIMNGGAALTLIDTAGGLAAMTLDGVMNEVTTNLSVNFIRPVKEGPVKVIANVMKNGKNLAFCRIEIRDEKEELYVDAIGNWFVFR